MITTNKINHDNVKRGNAAYKRRGIRADVDGITGGGRGTLGWVMDVFASLTGTDVTVRAAWVVACALVALAAISRMKPATPKRPAVVRVDQKPTPLYKDPPKQRKLQSGGLLGGGSLVFGAAVACIVALALALLTNTLSEFGR
jgi:hypothetical protein